MSILMALSSRHTYDLNGNLTGGRQQYLTWNARNGISGGSTASFSYDAFGRRIGKTISSTTTGYVYDGLNFVQEKDGAGSGASVTANLLAGGIDEVFLRSSSGTLTSYLTDALGSTLALSNAGETTLNSYSYEPYGATTPTGSSTNSQQYTGRENDGTGLYYYRARYYHPTLARFIGEDPIGWAAGQTNQFAYVDGNPISWIDSLGFERLVEAPKGHTEPGKTYYPTSKEYWGNSNPASGQGDNHQSITDRVKSACTGAYRNMSQCNVCCQVGCGKSDPYCRNACTAECAVSCPE